MQLDGPQSKAQSVNLGVCYVLQTCLIHVLIFMLCYVAISCPAVA